jgi:hypothetical protein
MAEPFVPPKFSRTELEEFRQWFTRELASLSGPRFLNGRIHVWRVIKLCLRKHKDAFPTPGTRNLLRLKRAIFELGIQTSHLVGIDIPNDVGAMLERWGWTEKEIRNFPGWAYRTAVIKKLIDSGPIGDFAELIQAGASHPLSEAEKRAIEIARRSAMEDLEPVYDSTGQLVQGDRLEREKGRLRRIIVEALVKRKHPLAVAREMYKVEKTEGIFRDFEQLAITEIASAFSKGSFQAERKAGKFRDDDLVYRISRPQACKLCLALYVNSDGTPRLYRVSDLEQGTTPLIDVGGNGRNLYRAIIGSTHPACLCSPWSKYWGAANDSTFREFAPQYRAARSKYRLD